jgi:hypothetical protein
MKNNVTSLEKKKEPSQSLQTIEKDVYLTCEQMGTSNL